MPDLNPAGPPESALRGDLFFASALFLFMELAFIRWFPAQVLFLTFFTNTVLLASFLGLSLGCLAARRSRDYLPLTAVLLVAALAAGAGMEGLRLALQDILDVGKNTTVPQVVYFGAEIRTKDVASFVVPMEWVAGFFFLLIAAAMIGLGQLIGRRFATLGNPVRAYVANVAGSLAGVLAFNLCSWWLAPVWWFGLAGAGLVYFLWRQTPRRWWAMAFAAAAPLAVLAPGWLSVGVIRQNYPVETWSPYYRINYSPDSRIIVVNLLGHQSMAGLAHPSPEYALPYMLNRDAGEPRFRDILIIGAGSGNDVSRALQWAAPEARIDAVEIDPVILSLGRRHHPEHPYQSPRVRAYLNDGRNFLRSAGRKYDLIIFALVDSLVLHSSVSDIRLESYLYTAEAMADVRRALKTDGLFVMYNYFRQGWIVSRLAKTLGGAFGQPPVVLTLPYRERVAAGQRSEGFTVLLAGARAQAIESAFRRRGPYFIESGVAPRPSSPDGFAPQSGRTQARFGPARVEIPAGLRPASDAWPFLYLRNPMIPDLSLRGILVIGLISAGLLWLFGWRTRGGQTAGLNTAMLLLGAGFMLLETKAIVHMALVFGSTWIVNTIVFSAVLVMILAANFWVLRTRPGSLRPFYLVLLAALALNVAVPLDSLLGLPVAVQGIAGGVLVLSPVLCAGVIFARLFAGAAKPEQALAWNTAGAMLGGLAESGSLLVGFQWLLVLAALIYAGAWVAGGRSRRPAGVEVAHAR
ncbi:MAG: hypothetical protein IT159_10580 [Bryobacterales bacterium]|nr:hypothetical protein [Bryobacterales bacterium]